MAKIAPFLLFDGRLSEAVAFYMSVFPNGRVVSENPMTATFVLEGQEFMGLNVGPKAPFTEAVSFFIRCDTQAEVDHYWGKLTADGGAESRCGWLKDRFGVSWQVIPEALGRYLGGADRAAAGRVMQAMMRMNKIIVADLDKAAAG